MSLSERTPARRKRRQIVGHNRRHPLVRQLSQIIMRYQSRGGDLWVIADRAEVSKQTLINWRDETIENPQLPKVARVVAAFGARMEILE